MTCTVEWCDLPKLARGLCTTHHNQWRKAKLAGRVWEPRSPRPCRVYGCSEWATSRRMCTKHRESTGMAAWSKGDSLLRDEAGLKRCDTCLEWLPESSYGQKSRAADGLRTTCKPCMKAQRMEYRYGVDEVTYQALAEEQQGFCAVCQTVMANPCLDHDHTTGKTRGLLCDPCNVGLGMFRDNPEHLRSAIAYLQRWGTLEP